MLTPGANWYWMNRSLQFPSSSHPIWKEDWDTSKIASSDLFFSFYRKFQINSKRRDSVSEWLFILKKYPSHEMIFNEPNLTFSLWFDRFSQKWQSCEYWLRAPVVSAEVGGRRDHILWTGLRPRMSKHLAMIEAVASHSSILHMLILFTSPTDKETNSLFGFSFHLTSSYLIFHNLTH